MTFTLIAKTLWLGWMTTAVLYLVNPTLARRITSFGTDTDPVGKLSKNFRLAALWFLLLGLSTVNIVWE